MKIMRCCLQRFGRASSLCKSPEGGSSRLPDKISDTDFITSEFYPQTFVSGDYEDQKQTLEHTDQKERDFNWPWILDIPSLNIQLKT